MTAPTPAERYNEEGRECADRGDVAGAERAYLAAAALEPQWAVPLYNLGLLYKYELRWNESLDFNRKALAADPAHEAALWNRGIAATALGYWTEARECWSKYGIADPGGPDPPVYAFGRAPVRLDPNGEGEVVWGVRLDPARVRLTNIPLPSSEFRFGDIVLNDGAAEGHRTIGEKTYPVFNVLQRLVPSALATFVVELASVDDKAIEALENIAHEMGGAAEHWGSSTQILCRDCSFGNPHEHSEAASSPAHPHCGLAAPDVDAARVILDRWLNSGHIADLVTWYEVEAS